MGTSEDKSLDAITLQATIEIGREAAQRHYYAAGLCLYIKCLEAQVKEQLETDPIWKVRRDKAWEYLEHFMGLCGVSGELVLEMFEANAADCEAQDSKES